jgi:outer membrane immunogenic protein
VWIRKGCATARAEKIHGARERVANLHPIPGNVPEFAVIRVPVASAQVFSQLVFLCLLEMIFGFVTGSRSPMIKKIFASASCAALAIAGVFAVTVAGAWAAPPGVAAAPNWSGVYGGLSGGYSGGHSAQTDTGVLVLPTVVEEEEDGHYLMRGGLLGGTLGYNWQRGAAVFGLEGDVSWADISGHSNICGPAGPASHPCGTDLNALGTFRGRMGIATGPNASWLLYATGGLAVGDIRGWDALTPASGNDWRAGWTVGLGVEAAFAPNWSAKLEYLYADLGRAPVFNVVPGVSENVGLTASFIRAGINYRFEQPAAAPQLHVKAPRIATGNGWSGWYAGVNAGYLDGANTVDTDAVVTSNSTTPITAPAMAAGATSRFSTGNGGFIGGGQLGYNRVLSPLFLASFEADLQGTSLHGNGSASTLVPTATFEDTPPGAWQTNIAASRRLDYIGTVRGRLGASVTPDLLLYVTGGVAYGGVKSSTTISQTTAIAGVPANATSGSFSDVRAGYVIGGGGEWMLISKWSVKAEYLHYDLGSANYGTGGVFVNEGPTSLPGFGIAAIATSTRVQFNGDIVRVGLNYHLD